MIVDRFRLCTFRLHLLVGHKMYLKSCGLRPSQIVEHLGWVKKVLEVQQLNRLRLFFFRENCLVFPAIKMELNIDIGNLGRNQIRCPNGCNRLLISHL